MPELYIIASCNGAGKTTASMYILPDVLNCREFVNADAIAAALSPFNPESVAFEAGRIMLNRVKQLLSEGVDFAFETTLATRSYVSLIKNAKKLGYRVTLLYFWLSSPEFAIERVATRVLKGGHNIPEDVIRRRYLRRLQNLVNLYAPCCDRWHLFDNTEEHSKPVVISDENGVVVINEMIWNFIRNLVI